MHVQSNSRWALGSSDACTLLVQRGLNITPIAASQLDQVKELWKNVDSGSLGSPDQVAPTYTEASRLLVQLLRDAGRLQDVTEVESKLSSIR